MCSAGDVNFVSSSIGSRFLPLVTPRGNSLCCASSWLESLLFSGLVHSSLWCLTCLGRQPARWVVYRFHFWPNGSEDERMWEASGWCWGCPSVRTNRPSRAPQRLSARHWMNKQLVLWHSKKVAHVMPSPHSPCVSHWPSKLMVYHKCQTRFNTKKQPAVFCACASCLTQPNMDSSWFFEAQLAIGFPWLSWCSPVVYGYP